MPTSSKSLGNFTVKLAVQVLGDSQLLFTSKLTSVEPPVLGGAPELLFEKIGLHPPLKFADANQAENFASIADCVCPAASSRSIGQFNITGGASVTENVALQVFGGSQSLVSVNHTVLIPPQNDGAPLLSLLNAALQPPENETVRNQIANKVSIATCV